MITYNDIIENLQKNTKLTPSQKEYFVATSLKYLCNSGIYQNTLSFNQKMKVALIIFNEYYKNNAFDGSCDFSSSGEVTEEMMSIMSDFFKTCKTIKAIDISNTEFIENEINLLIDNLTENQSITSLNM
jgi:hypothetical protein